MRSDFAISPLFLVIIFCILFISCRDKKPLFEIISSDHSSIHFNNQIPDDDSINIIKVQNVYNGGGVGIGDFNNDGLLDIYFTGNEVSNKLYLNKGNFQFEDITEAAGVNGSGKWCRGVAVVDINNDGWMDMYVCATLKKDPSQRRNLLYINQGLDKNGIPHFKEMAAEYGLGDTVHSTMAAFFDYDNDGDLDMFLTVNEIKPGENPDLYRNFSRDGSASSTSRLYRNDWNAKLKHPVFTDVSKQAGITIEGYGHDVTIADINNDGWKDIYVSNDFISNDLLYINNHDGTFTEKSQSYFKHTAANGMGQDIEDINNDGLPDIVELDMSPEDNYRKKMMLNGNRYLNYQNSEKFGYTHQYVRNNLQLNCGRRVNQNDSIGDPIFSDISFFSGIAETDWSWTPMVADFDNDGYRDIIITNGFPKDVTDHDFIAFNTISSTVSSPRQILREIPQVRLHKYAFRNNGNLTFSNVSTDWGFTAASFSNGAAYADLDNDGDLDLIINNINDEATILKNTSRENNKESNNYLQVLFEGDSTNRNGLGAEVELHYDHGKQQQYENTPYRGYLSSIQPGAHFGLGRITAIDSIIVKWPDGKMQLLKNVNTNQVLKVNIKNADSKYNYPQEFIAKNTLFKEITDSLNIHYLHEQQDFIDFNIQKLLPHKLSEFTPSLAVGDINGDGIDDIIVGGSALHSAQLFFQQANGQFIQKALIPSADSMNKKADDLGILLFDADGDGDLDLYIASGGNSNPANSEAYQDRLYINDGKGNFTLDLNALPKNFTSKFCVRAADFDHDGDLDLFISGRVDPWHYPSPVSSFIYRNDSKNGQIKFTDVTNSVAKDLINIGMVCDATWTDFNNDGWPDLVLAGEWMPVTFLKNDKGTFKNVSDRSNINDQLGWWNSIVAGDFNNDGKMDYVVGNTGKNTFYRASEQFPVRVYAKDFDSNGIYDMIPSVYLPDTEGNMQEFPAQGRDDMLSQINAMRRKFPSFKSYAVATMDKVLTEQDRKGALILKANNLQTSFLKNEAGGKFSMSALPSQAQFSMINGMLADDFDGDGNIDLLMNGNDYGTEVSVGRYDALNGLFLHGDGKGNFSPETILQSGIFIPGNGKALVKFRGANGACLIAASQNRGRLKIFELKRKCKTLPLEPMDVSAQIKYKNGKTIFQEFYYGSSFLSQSGRFILLNDDVSSVTITNNLGKTRNIHL